MRRFLLVIFLALAIVKNVDASVSASFNEGAAENSDSGAASSIGGITLATGELALSDIGDKTECPEKPWTDAQTAARVVTTDIFFDTVFRAPPTVFLSVTRLATSNGGDVSRYQLKILEVTGETFTLEVSTWCNSYINKITVSYVAIGNGI